MERRVDCRRNGVVERTFSWFGRNRCLAKDLENLAETLVTFVTLASIELGLRRLAREKAVLVEVCKAWSTDLRQHRGQRRDSAESGYLHAAIELPGSTEAVGKLRLSICA
jgi:hypothetical protein